jgi:hypothetical protein
MLAIVEGFEGFVERLIDVSTMILPSSIIGNGVAREVNQYLNFFGHSTIALQLISRYLADATTYIGLVGRGCRSDGRNVSNTTVLYDSRRIDRVLYRNQ